MNKLQHSYNKEINYMQLIDSITNPFSIYELHFLIIHRLQTIQFNGTFYESS